MTNSTIVKCLIEIYKQKLWMIIINIHISDEIIFTLWILQTIIIRCDLSIRLRWWCDAFVHRSDFIHLSFCKQSCIVLFSFWKFCVYAKKKTRTYYFIFFFGSHMCYAILCQYYVFFFISISSYIFWFIFFYHYRPKYVFLECQNRRKNVKRNENIELFDKYVWWQRIVWHFAVFFFVFFLSFFLKWIRRKECH